MDSSLYHGPPLYDSIPDSSPRQAPLLRNVAPEHQSRVSRSSSVSRALKALSVLTLIAATLFLVSKRCISCGLFTHGSRIFKRTPYRQAVVHPYAPTEYSDFRSNILQMPGPFHRYPANVVSRFPRPTAPYLNRESAALEAEDFLIQEFVGTRDCYRAKFCRARLIVSKKGSEVAIRAGYNISGIGGVDRDMDSLTRSRVSAVTIDETLRWAHTLLGRVHDRLVELDCITTLENVAAAIYFTSTIAATCPRTDDARCHQLITVQRCTSPIPTPIPTVAPTPVPKDSCEVAFEECEFTFAGESGLATFSIDGPSDKSFTPVIVAKDARVNLGVLNSNNIEPEFIEDSGVYPVSGFGLPRFAPTQFKPYYIWQQRGSGIGHQAFYGTQEELARDRCIRIFFTHIQLVDPYSNLNQVPRSENKCVVFRTE